MTSGTPTTMGTIQGPTRRRLWWTISGLILLGVTLWALRSGLVLYWSKACVRSQDSRQWEDLEKTAAIWARWQPEAVEPWLFLADAAQRQNRFLEAADFLSRVPRQSDKAVPALQARLQILCGPANRPLEGELACRELLAIESRATLAHQSLIQFYALTLQRTKLRDQVREAIALDREPPESYVYYFLGDTLRLSNGVSMNSRWLATDPDQELYLVAHLLHQEAAAPPEELESQQPDRSADSAILSQKEQEARELLQKFPQNTNLLAYLIDQEISKGSASAVLELFRHVPKQAESEGRFWRFKGWLHYSRGELAEAESDYRRALELFPMDWLSLSRLSEVLRAQQRMDDIPRIQELVHQAQDIRSQIRDLGTTEHVPESVLKDIGRLARGCGDNLIANALEKRLNVGGGDRPGQSSAALK